ncbi:Serine/threonine-protein kinase nrc-2 [Zancudomyces culisetae]|uniref:non-specific serine/threonine protein kinase n=1 Tax=Zancudomyces culisetae TaxID=1213189 RepID=A0A1R1PQ39_ZANCU|nr:Serine/threonine-protein kinase nrc-2 [Zancudomyces culisetae]|eukprot:OMH83077.1 Serine/threonine-protein kinase nrc-2 [Zancudomyces culisetae]
MTGVMNETYRSDHNLDSTLSELPTRAMHKHENALIYDLSTHIYDNEKIQYSGYFDESFATSGLTTQLGAAQQKKTITSSKVPIKNASEYSANYPFSVKIGHPSRYNNGSELQKRGSNMVVSDEMTEMKNPYNGKLDVIDSSSTLHKMPGPTSFEKRSTVNNINATAQFVSSAFNGTDKNAFPNISTTISPTSNFRISFDTRLERSFTNSSNQLLKRGSSKIRRKSTIFRDYSKNSVKIQQVTVGPSSFEKVKLLGIGGVGKVFLVRQVETSNLYAMKIMSKTDMIKRNKIKRALTEQDILATANFPFIVTLFHSFQCEKYLYLVMDYCLGGEFYRELRSLPGKRLLEPAAKFYAAEITLALEYLHLNGYIYRDLKPENILLHESGHIMLADFDLSKHANPVYPPSMSKRTSIFSQEYMLNTNVCTSKTRANSFVGTEEYIAPEILNGVGHSSTVDWWTLGILIYEMLYGFTPFRGKNRSQTFENILNKDLIFHGAPLHQDVSSSCKTLVRGLLQKNKLQRLGGKDGASEIKSSSWFKDINFALLMNFTPPIVPLNDPKKLKFLQQARRLGHTKEEKKELLVSGGEESTKQWESEGIIKVEKEISFSQRANTNARNPFARFNSISLVHSGLERQSNELGGYLDTDFDGNFDVDFAPTQGQ